MWHRHAAASSCAPGAWTCRLDCKECRTGPPARRCCWSSTGRLHITLDGVRHDLTTGDVALVPAHSELCVDGGPDGATAWVTTTPGLEAVIADGTRLTPPWAR